MWVQAGGGLEGGVLQSVEAGFVRHYGGNTRLFVYETSNSYQPGSSCWNTNCAFIQTASGHWLDWDWGNYSVMGGQQEEVSVSIIKDYSDGDWWVVVDGTWVGYWPQSIFNSPGLYYNGSHFSFGGEVYQYYGPDHTRTHMGSGGFANTGYRYAAYQRLLQDAYGAYQWEWTDNALTTMQDANPNCYTGSYTYGGSDPVWGDYFYFGGPGFNANCLQ